jgi:YVTN family beta-propeller protein
MGLIGNQKVDRITAFDPNAVTLQGGVGISRGSNAEHYAMAINPLGHRGYVSDERSSTIHDVSLESMPPTVQNTFNATHSASFLATFPGQQALLLVAAGMDGRQGVVSTMTVTGNQVDRINLGRDTRPEAIALCDDEKTLLVAVDVPHEVRKLTVANDGSLSSTGKSYSLKHGTRAADVLCAPGSGTGVVIIGHGGASGGSGAQAYAESFDVSSMSRLHTERLAQRIGVSAVFSPQGKTLYVRSDQGSRFGQSSIQAFTFHPSSGRFGSVSKAPAPPVGAQLLRDASTLAISQDGSRLFVTDSWNDKVLVLDSGTLSTQQTLSGNLAQPLSITISGGARSP